MGIVIGLTGAAGSGKDTVADMLARSPGVQSTSFVPFAGALKSICVLFLGLSENDVHTQEGKMKYNQLWGMTNREILQKVGTDAMRNGFHPDVWMNIAFLQIAQDLGKYDLVLVPDVRFDNEAELIKDTFAGEIWQINRNHEAICDDTHPSEQ